MPAPAHSLSESGPFTCRRETGLYSLVQANFTALTRQAQPLKCMGDHRHLTRGRRAGCGARHRAVLGMRGTSLLLLRLGPPWCAGGRQQIGHEESLHKLAQPSVTGAGSGWAKCEKELHTAVRSFVTPRSLNVNAPVGSQKRAVPNKALA